MALTVTATATETSLDELKETLVDIQINIANIFRENKSIRNELTELTTTVREQRHEIAHLKTSLTKVTKQCSDNEHELAAARKRVNEQQDEIYELYVLQDKLEQYTRKNSLEIHGVPESTYSTTEEVVLKLAEALEVSLTPQDVEISHKLKHIFFLRRLIDLSTLARLPHHHVTMDREACRDIAWWLRFLPSWNGRAIIPDSCWTKSSDLELFTDASGYGIFYMGHWLADPWPPKLWNRSIQWQGLCPIALACLLWGHQWSGKKLLFHCDNQAVVDI